MGLEHLTKRNEEQRTTAGCLPDGNAAPLNEKTGEPENLGKNVGLVMLLSTLARVLSLLGSILYTTHFGYTLETDIYSYAVNLPNLVFTCLGTALVTVVIPIFAGRLAAGEKKNAYAFIDSILTIALIVATLIAVIGIVFSPAIVSLVARFDTGDRTLALFALRLMFPIMIFHSINYIFQGVLQSNRRFVMPAIVSAFSGLSVILYVLLLADRFGIRGLLAATFFGLMLQAAALIPSIRSIGYHYHARIDFQNVDVRSAGRLTLPVLVSSSSYQLNMFINNIFAAGFAGGVIAVTNMQTLAFTAAQLFILSTLAVYFPKMSALYATRDYTGYRRTFSEVLRLIIYFAIPASAGLAFLSKYLIRFLYGWGKVTESDMAVSAAVFSLYALSIASIGFKEAADRAYYAMRDSKTPAAIGMFIMCLNVTLSIILKGTFGLIGLAAAYFLSITCGSLVLLWLLRKRERKEAHLARAGIGQHVTAEQPVDSVVRANNGNNDKNSKNNRNDGNDSHNSNNRKNDRKGDGLQTLLIKCAASTVGMLIVLFTADRLLTKIITAQTSLFYLLMAISLTVLGAVVYFVSTQLLQIDEAVKIKGFLLHIVHRRKPC